MEYVPLGKSGLTASVIGLGGGSSGRFGLVKGGTKADAIRLIQLALDLGITIFDGAGIAGGVDGILAEGLGNRREDVILSTKVQLGPGLLSNSRFMSRASSWLGRRAGLVCSGETIRKRVERTLKELRTDRIDLLHLHAVSPDQYPGAVLRVLPELLKLKEQGKVRAIGITEGFLTDPTHRMLSAAVRDARVDAIMVGFNPSNSGAAAFVLPQARKAGIGTIGMFAVRGFSGEAADEANALLDEAGSPNLADLAYRFSRHHVDVVLTGTGDPDHLKQNVAAALRPPLPRPVLQKLRSLGG